MTVEVFPVIEGWSPEGTWFARREKRLPANPESNSFAKAHIDDNGEYAGLVSWTAERPPGRWT